MSGENIRYAYRVCPCFTYDVEGIQTWLEDLAAQGLVLEKDGTFLGIFTFQKTAPKTYRYRLAPIRERGGIFSDSSDDPSEEEQEFSKTCGWEYLVRYGSFYIYRATGEDVRPLHTDPAVHRMALEAVKKQRASRGISAVTNLILYSVLSHNLFSFFRSGALAGLVFLLSILGFGFWLAGNSIASIIRLSRYQKRLQEGDTLDKPRQWKASALPVRLTKLIPLLCVVGFLFGWLHSVTRAGNPLPLAGYPQDPPVATLEDVFPEAEIDYDTNRIEYNSVTHYRTALSENFELNQLADIWDESGSYYGILRIQHHKTASKFWARGLFRDYFIHERLRFRGKRFEELEVPQTGFDEVKVYSSYGILHILIRQDCTVTHATVSITQQGQNNQWQLWLDAMEEIGIHSPT